MSIYIYIYIYILSILYFDIQYNGICQNKKCKCYKNYSDKNCEINLCEDLIENTRDTFEKIINFLSKHTNIKYNEEKFNNSIDTTKFDILKKNEEKFGFNMGQKNKFFYLGKENNWENLLDSKIEKKIRETFRKEKKELDYIQEVEITSILLEFIYINHIQS